MLPLGLKICYAYDTVNLQFERLKCLNNMERVFSMHATFSLMIGKGLVRYEAIIELAILCRMRPHLLKNFDTSGQLLLCSVAQTH